MQRYMQLCRLSTEGYVPSLRITDCAHHTIHYVPNDAEAEGGACNPPTQHRKSFTQTQQEQQHSFEEH